jgi:hypothetical protein
LKASAKKKAEFLAVEGQNTRSLPTTLNDGFMKIIWKIIQLDTLYDSASSTWGQGIGDREQFWWSATFDHDPVLGDEVIPDNVLGDSFIRDIHDVGLSYGPTCSMMLPMQLEP